MNKDSYIRIQIPQEPKKVFEYEDQKVHSRNNPLDITLIFLQSSLNKLSMSLSQNLTNIDIIMIINLFISFLLYIFTLKGCSSHIVMECVPEIVPLIPLGLFIALISSFQLDVVLYLALKKHIRRSYLYVIIVQIVVIFVISQGSTFQSHGLFNKLIYSVFLIINFVFIWALNFIIKLLYKYPRKTLLFIVVLLFFSVFSLNNLRQRGSCENWTKGFKDSAMDNTKFCRIKEPTFCFNEFAANWFDLSVLLDRNDCSKVKSLISLKETPKSEEFLAYPKTQYFTKQEKFLENFQKKILEKVTPIAKKDLFNSQYEVFLNKTVPESPSIFIQVQKNSSLIERSAKILKEKPTISPVKNVLSIFLDSVSRQHFPRKLPKTYSWIESYYNNKSSSHESFQFFKFHASGTHTLPNMMRAFYGTDYKSASDAVSLARIYKKEGFITAKSSNLCSATYFDVTGNDKYMKDFDIEPFDHENIAFSCDPNYRKMDADGPYSYLVGSTAMVRRCLYGQDVHDYVLDYGKQFWRTYKENNKFLELDLMDGHEPSAELLKYLDDPLYEFLNTLEKENLFNDTAIVFYADHGHHLNIVYYLFNLTDLMYELRLPMLFVLLPRQLEKKLGEYLKTMEQVLVSTYDLYNLFSFFSGNEYRIAFGIDYQEKVHQERGVEELNLEEHLCLCQK